MTSCIERLAAMETAEQISHLRSRANEIVKSIVANDKSLSQPKLQKMMNGLLHLPTMRVRESKISGSELVDMIDDIECKLWSSLELLKEENNKNV